MISAATGWRAAATISTPRCCRRMRGWIPAESAALNARLVLILANLAGDPEAVIAAIDHARRPPA